MADSTFRIGCSPLILPFKRLASCYLIPSIRSFIQYLLSPMTQYCPRCREYNRQKSLSPWSLHFDKRDKSYRQIRGVRTVRDVKKKAGERDGELGKGCTVRPGPPASPEGGARRIFQAEGRASGSGEGGLGCLRNSHGHRVPGAESSRRERAAPCGPLGGFCLLLWRR